MTSNDMRIANHFQKTDKLTQTVTRTFGKGGLLNGKTFDRFAS